MRHLILVLFLFIPFLTFAQGNPPCDVTVSNINCDGSTISFDLTVTEDGNPLRLRGTETIEFTEVGSPNRVLEFDPNPSNNSDPDQTNTFFDALPVTSSIESGFDCDDIVGKELLIDDFPSLYASPNNCETEGLTVFFGDPSNEPLPNMSLWSIIILGLGVVLLSVILLLRRGKEIGV